MVEQIIILLLPAIASLVSVNWVFLKILSIAKRKGLVDNPNSRKLQKNPVPVLGGLAVVFGLLSGMAVYVAVCMILNISVTTMGVSLLPIILCCSIMLYVGSLDDILGLTAKSRLIIEVLTMLVLIFGSGLCVDSLHGLWGVENFSWWIAVPLTVFAGVGIINAYNMVDGVNGLSSGLCITCSVILGVICLKRMDLADAALSFCFAASLVPFLLHNVFGKRSRMFIGDGGTMVMGLLVSWFTIRILSSNNADSLTCLAVDGRELGLVAMMLAVVCVPVFDTLRVMTSRIMKGKSPFNPDKTHLHHIFIEVGFSHSTTTSCEILINVLVCAIWYLVYRLGVSVEVQLYVVIVFAMLLVWGTYFFLSRIVRKHPRSSLFKWARTTHFEDTKWWISLQRWLDMESFEDFSVLLNKRIEDMDYKERDTVAIMNYLQGKKAVNVADIIAESGAEKLRVYTILFELEQANLIIVLEQESLGAPKVVRINSKALENVKVR